MATKTPDKRKPFFSNLKYYGLGAGALRGDTESVRKLIGSEDITDITLGSFLWGGSNGNKADTETGTLWYLPDGSIGNNAIGMKCEPIKAYIKVLEEIYALTQAAGVRLILSIASTANISEEAIVHELYQICDATKHCCDGWEVNEGCPNIIGKPIQGYSVSLLKKKLASLADFCKDGVPRFRFKLPNYKVSQLWAAEKYQNLFADMDSFAIERGYKIIVHESDFTRSTYEIFDDVCKIISSSSIISAVVGPNTLPFVEVIDLETNKPVLSYNGGNTKGGLSGKILQELAYDQLQSLRNKLPTRIAVIGMGCGCDGAAIKKILSTGADGVLFTTGYLAKGPYVFGEALAEYAG
jgi:dihydroorotate dehydrogenase